MGDEAVASLMMKVSKPKEDMSMTFGLLLLRLVVGLVMAGHGT